MSCLIQELSNPSQQVHVRSAAGLALKNALTSKDSNKKEMQKNKWLNLGSSRNSIKLQILQTLGSDVGFISSQVQIILILGRVFNCFHRVTDW
jgi:hypothetical protein